MDKNKAARKALWLMGHMMAVMALVFLALGHFLWSVVIAWPVVTTVGDLATSMGWCFAAIGLIAYAGALFAPDAK